MLAHKLDLDAFVDQPFKLIAIHSSVEDYKLAFLLNKHLGLRLARARNDVDFYNKSVRAFFALFQFRDQHKYCEYYLICNKFKGQSKTTGGSGSLFGDEEMASKTIHLLPELSKVDFLLKIEEESGSFPERKLLERIKEIPQIATAYTIDINDLKSKENLIFD